MRKAFAIWLMAGLPVLADSVAATRSWVSNRVAEARAEWRGDVAAATNPVPSWISAAEGRVDVRITGATNGLPERIASVTNGLPERIASVTNGLPAKMAALTNGLPAKIAAVTNGLPERMAALTNGLPEAIAGATNGLPERIASVTNDLPERLAAVTSGVPALVSAAADGVMGEVAAATGSLWTAIGNIEGVTADIGALARTNDVPAKVSQLDNDLGFLTNHQDLAAYALSAGVFPDWASKSGWAAGEFCTWKGKVYRRSRNGDGSTAPDISPVSWIASDVGTAIAEARPDMSSLTNPIPSWIAASTNGLPEAIAASTNGLPAKIASVTNGLPERIAAVTNGLPEQIASVTNGLPELVAASTNGIPEAIAASTNGVVERATEAAIGAVAGLDAKTAYRLSGPPPYDRAWIDGTGAVYEAHAAPLIVSNGVTWTRLRDDRLFPTAAESLALSDEGGMLTWTWTNGVDEIATWGESQAQDLDGRVYGGEYPECVFFTKHMTFADIDPDPSWVAYGFTMHLDPSYRWGWTSARLTVIYRSPYMPSGIAGTELHFVTAAVQSASGTYPATLVSASTNATNAVVSVNVTGFPNAVLTTGITRALTLPRTVTFRPDAVPVMVDRLATESAVTVTADPLLSPASTNPVQNKVVTAALDARPTKEQIDAGWWSKWTVSPASFAFDGRTYEPLVTRDFNPETGEYEWALGANGFGSISSVPYTGEESVLTFVDYSGETGFDSFTATRHRVAAPVPTKTSNLKNDGADGAHPFISQEEVQHQQLAPVYSQTPTYGWACAPATYNGQPIEIVADTDWENKYIPYANGEQIGSSLPLASGKNTITWPAGVEWSDGVNDLTATLVRTDIIGYTLGDQTNDVLASTNYLAATVTNEIATATNGLIGAAYIATNNPAFVAAVTNCPVAIAAGDAEALTQWGIYGGGTIGALLAALAAAVAALRRDKADKSEMSVTPGTGSNADKTTIQLKTGTSATVLTSHQDLRYAMVVPPLALSDTSDSDDTATVQLQDRAMNQVTLGAGIAYATLTFPAKETGKARDFFVRLTITGSDVPTLYFKEQGGAAVAFDADDDSWAEIEQGVNVLMFTDTSEVIS